MKVLHKYYTKSKQSAFISTFEGHFSTPSEGVNIQKNSFNNKLEAFKNVDITVH